MDLQSGLIAKSTETTKVKDSFKKLIAIDADSCDLETISKKNFKGLNKLRSLELQRNQIEKISSDTFKDLVSLEYLILYRNNLKFINGKAFVKLTKLIKVNLDSNECIDEEFTGQSQISELQQTVNGNCSFKEGFRFFTFNSSAEVGSSILCIIIGLITCLINAKEL